MISAAKHAASPALLAFTTITSPHRPTPRPKDVAPLLRRRPALVEHTAHHGFEGLDRLVGIVGIERHLVVLRREFDGAVVVGTGDEPIALVRVEADVGSVEV